MFDLLCVGEDSGRSILNELQLFKHIQYMQMMYVTQLLKAVIYLFGCF